MNLSRALLAAVAILSFVPVAHAGGHDDGGCDCCHRTCAPCEEIVKEKKVCWNVECKDICIPGICWPFCKGCRAEVCGAKGKGCKGHAGPCDEYQPTCGHVKTVRVLKPEFYDVEKCKFTWKVEGKGGAK